VRWVQKGATWGRLGKRGAQSIERCFRKNSVRTKGEIQKSFSRAIGKKKSAGYEQTSKGRERKGGAPYTKDAEVPHSSVDTKHVIILVETWNSEKGPKNNEKGKVKEFAEQIRSIAIDYYYTRLGGTGRVVSNGAKGGRRS